MREKKEAFTALSLSLLSITKTLTLSLAEIVESASHYCKIEPPECEMDMVLSISTQRRKKKQNNNSPEKEKEPLDTEDHISLSLYRPTAAMRTGKGAPQISLQNRAFRKMTKMTHKN